MRDCSSFPDQERGETRRTVVQATVSAHSGMRLRGVHDIAAAFGHFEVVLPYIRQVLDRCLYPMYSTKDTRPQEERRGSMRSDHGLLGDAEMRAGATFTK